MYILENPVYGSDYKDGYVFFSYNTNSFVSRGIALFQACEMKSGQPVSHCGFISGPNKCFEATTPKVCESDFSKYINDPHTVVFLRKPIGWTLEKAQLMIKEGRRHIGETYAYTGILGSALRVVLSWSYKWWPSLRYKRDPFNSTKQMFCSEYVARCMVPAIGKIGCLQYDATNIYPSTLFEDTIIWTPWNYGIVDQKLAEGKCIVQA